MNFWTLRSSLQWVACLLAPILLSSITHAQRASGPPAQTHTKFRLTPPFGQIFSVNPGREKPGGGGLTFGGVSIEVELYEMWSVEVGAALVVTSIEGVSRDLFARGGVVPVVYDGRNRDGHGWTVQLDALVGYRQLERREAPDAHFGTELTHGLRGNVGVDFTRHFLSSGVGVRLLSGVTLPIHQQRTGSWETHDYIEPHRDLAFALDLGIDVAYVR